MKDNKIWAALCIAIGLAAAGLAIKAGMDNFTNRSRQVTVKGLAEKEVKADKVTWMLNAELTSSTAKEAREGAREQAKKLVTFLTDCGIKKTDIFEGIVQVTTNTEWDQNTRRSIVTGYTGTKSVSVQSKDIETVRKAIARQDEFAERGIQATENSEYRYDDNGQGSYTNLIYDIEDFQSMKLELMDEAIVNAEAAAQRFAANSKSDVGKIISANQGVMTIDNKDRFTPHIKRVRVVSTITYALKD